MTPEQEANIISVIRAYREHDEEPPEPEELAQRFGVTPTDVYRAAALLAARDKRKPA